MMTLKFVFDSNFKLLAQIIKIIFITCHYQKKISIPSIIIIYDSIYTEI